MKPIEPLPFTQWADVHRNEKFVAVAPRSGYRMVQPEDDGYTIYLRPDADDEALGRALLEAMDRSRFIWPRDEPEFFEAERYMRCFRERDKDFMRRYGYKTKHDLYKNMSWCRLTRSEGKIKIRPHHRRDQPGLWKWLSPEEDVVVPDTRDAAALGAALRLALDRCE